MKNMLCAMDQDQHEQNIGSKPHECDIIFVTSQFKLFGQTLQFRKA